MAVIVARVSIRIERRRLSELTEMTIRQQAEMAARYGSFQSALVEAGIAPPS